MTDISTSKQRCVTSGREPVTISDRVVELRTKLANIEAAIDRKTKESKSIINAYLSRSIF